MYSPRHATTRRHRPYVAAAGLAALAVAAAGTLATDVPGHAATPSSRTAPSFLVGGTPIDVAVATYAGRAYVATGDQVAVTDTHTHQVVSTVPTGLQDQTAITLVQSGAKAYVGSFTGRRLAIYDT